MHTRFAYRAPEAVMMRLFYACIVGVFFCFAVVSASCPSQCSGRGVCTVGSKCACFSGFTGPACTQSEFDILYSSKWSAISSTVQEHAQGARLGRTSQHQQTGHIETTSGRSAPEQEFATEPLASVSAFQVILVKLVNGVSGSYQKLLFAENLSKFDTPLQRNAHETA